MVSKRLLILGTAIWSPIYILMKLEMWDKLGTPELFASLRVVSWEAMLCVLRWYAVCALHQVKLLSH